MRIVTLTTDFGLRDAFVASMKGVILSLAPDVTVVDVTHEVAPQDVWGGALSLAQAAPFFPRGTIHVAVVDPGVGSERAAVVIEARDALFVGPDNGLLTLAAPADAPAYRIEDPVLLRSAVSATFHGRDVFAPVAAHLAGGLAPCRMGSRHDVVRLRWPEEPEVIHVDRFGNLILSLRGIPEGAEALEIDGIGRALVARTYSDAQPGTLVAYVGSSGLAEIAVRNGRAAERVACCLPGGDVRGLRVRIVR